MKYFKSIFYALAITFFSCHSDGEIGAIIFTADEKVHYQLFDSRGRLIGENDIEEKPFRQSMDVSGIFILNATAGEKKIEKQTIVYPGGEFPYHITF